MTTLTIILWISIFIIFYTYIGYGIALFCAVKVKRRLCPDVRPELPRELPEVTLLIAAYNEEAVVESKMRNCREVDYPAERLHIVWVTDGSTDATNARLALYADVEVLFESARGGKTAALNRAIGLLKTPLVVCTDANTMINSGAVREIVRLFEDKRVGCVAGEKRVAVAESAASTEGVYWRYESKLKEWDYALYSAVGAAGELFAIRRELYEELPTDTLLDDFVISMRIAMRGYVIAYSADAYALESASADMREEGKRKRRIAAGGLQATWRLRRLLNPLRYGCLWWQYVSHRVLRWSLTPLLLVALIPINVALVVGSPCRWLYGALLAGQVALYASAAVGWWLARSGKRSRIFSIPYYFVFMNLNVFRGLGYLVTHRGVGVWEKAKRA